MPNPNSEIKIIASNKRARHDYHILETYEAGLVLKGTEVKSLRDGKASLSDSYASIEKGEVFVHNLHISPYEKGNRYNTDPKRDKKLLLNKREIRKLIGAVTKKGFTLIPLKMYFKNGYAKLEIAIAKGKKFFDKREDMKKRDDERDIDRYMKKYKPQRHEEY